MASFFVAGARFLELVTIFAFKISILHQVSQNASKNCSKKVFRNKDKSMTSFDQKCNLTRILIDVGTRVDHSNLSVAVPN